MTDAGPVGSERMLAPTTVRLGRIHRDQVHRDPWPDEALLDASRIAAAFPAELRREAAIQWAGRARAEHGSVHQFTQIAHALCNARMPLELHGALARLVTDEVRHAELCARTALACWPEGRTLEPEVFAWSVPRPPWPEPPPADAGEAVLCAWAAEAIAIACCLGETLSRPMLDAIAVVATDPLPEAVARQILRDEHLHAAFGWDAVEVLLPRAGDDAAARVQAAFARGLAGIERSTCCGHCVADVAGRELVIERTETPNLGTLDGLQYAMIYYATVESEVLPAIDRLGLSGARAWVERG